MGKGVQSGGKSLMDAWDWAGAGSGHTLQHWAHHQKCRESFEKGVNFGSHPHSRLPESASSLGVSPKEGFCHQLPWERLIHRRHNTNEHQGRSQKSLLDFDSSVWKNGSAIHVHTRESGGGVRWVGGRDCP